VSEAGVLASCQLGQLHIQNVVVIIIVVVAAGLHL
jgi:hypothetical protein